MVFKEITSQNFDQVVNIYWQGIQTGHATFETSIPTFETWDKSHLDFARITAFENNIMLGWAALSKVSDRCVYKGVAEISIYISPNFQGKGIGKTLLLKLIEESEKNGIWTLQCGIMKENKASINLHLKCGFRIVGYREKVGKLDGVWRDNIIMERRSKTTGIN